MVTREEERRVGKVCIVSVMKGLARVPALDLDAPSGFHWLPFTKFELQVYNIRHAQHHAAQLADRLRASGNGGVPWVSAA